MSSFSEFVLQEKLSRLTSSQESIETLSLWIIHHRTNAAIIAQKWSENFLHAQLDKRLTLFYLINDVLQNSRRKNITTFSELFESKIKDAVAIVSETKLKKPIERIIQIWKERNIFEETYLTQLNKLLNNGKSSFNNQDKVDFKVSLLEDSLIELEKFEGEMKIKLNTLSQLPIDVSSADSLTKLKDKASGDQFKSDFQNSAVKLEEYVECTGIEVAERKNLLQMLGDCKLYHKQQKNELESLLKDYKQLQNHLTTLDIKLKERLQELDKAQHTATSDPTSSTDITVAGDMEIDSDSETEAPPIEPHPLPPSVPFHPLAPAPVLPPLSFISGPPPLNPSLPVPYSPSMPLPFTPTHLNNNMLPTTPITPSLTTPTNNNVLPTTPITPSLITPTNNSSLATPNSNDSTPLTPPSLDNRLKDMSDNKSLPKDNSLPDSLFNDYSDESEDDDRPYSPSLPIKLNAPTSPVPPTLATPTSSNNITFYGTGSFNGDNNVTTPIKGVVTPTDSSTHTKETTPSKTLNPEDFKITPSLTTLLGEIFPRLSKTLEERKRRASPLPSNDNKHSKSEDEQYNVNNNELHPPIDHTPEHYSMPRPSFSGPPFQHYPGRPHIERFPRGPPHFPHHFRPPPHPMRGGPRPPYYNNNNSLRPRYY